MTVVGLTGVDWLSAAQADGQTFTASTSYRTICATAIGYSTIKDNADPDGEGNWGIGTYIADHPYLGGSARTIDSHSACAYATLAFGYYNGQA